MIHPDYTSLLNSALSGLLPEGVACAVSRIPDEAHFEYPTEAGQMRVAGDYRKCEFVAGRDCARAALQQAGFARSPILADDNGVPSWPKGALASISHSRGYCAAIAAKRSEYQTLGLDLEKTNRLSASAIERIVHPSEQAYVQGEQRKASLIFCAKEAFFKAQFPIWYTHANFHDLELAVDEALGVMHVQTIGERFPQELRALATEIQFRFSYFEEFVVSACWLGPSH